MYLPGVSLVPMTNNNIIPEIDSIFKASTRHHGVFNPNAPTKEKQCSSSKAPVTENDWIMHLSGRRGLGLAPILDDDTCRWAAIDVDNHEEGGSVPLGDIAERMAMYRFPGIVCRSKSGSVHIYVFFTSGFSAHDVVELLKKWAVVLKLKKYHPQNAKPEIFPKQTMLNGEGYPNWINLPYFGISEANPHGDRFAFFNGEKLTVTQFIAWAKTNIIGPVVFDELKNYKQPPSCIVAFQYYGIKEGGRNNAVYNVTRYWSLVRPHQGLKLIREFNKDCLSPPLPDYEIRTLSDKMRKGYKKGYICKGCLLYTSPSPRD